MKVVDLQPGHQAALESGTPKTGDIAVLMTDVYGRSVVHKSGVPKVGEKVLVGTDENGKPVAIRSGDVSSDPIVDFIWSDATGQYIYFFYQHPYLSPFYTYGVIPEKTPISYQTKDSKSRLWIMLYSDIRMQPADEPFPDEMISTRSLSYTNGRPFLYHEFLRTFCSDYYSPEYWETMFWNLFNDEAINNWLLTSANSNLLYHAGIGNFGAMSVGKQPSAFVNTRELYSGLYYLFEPKMYTNEPTVRYGYPNGRMQLEYEVTEMLCLDPEYMNQGSNPLIESTSIIPIQRICDYADGIERHDRWGTIWAYGLWKDNPAIAYHLETKTITPYGVTRFGDGDIKYVNEERPDCSFMPYNNYVFIKPFSFTTLSDSDLITFPDKGIILLSTLKDLNNDVADDGDSARRVRQFGIYGGNSGSSLQQVQFIGWPANSIYHDNPGFWLTGEPPYYYTSLVDKYARVELTHTIRSGPLRISKFTIYLLTGSYSESGPPVIVTESCINKIKLAGGFPDEMEMPASGYFLYVGKYISGLHAGKIYEMAMYRYEKNSGWLDCQSVAVPGMLSSVESEFPYFVYQRDSCCINWLDIDFHIYENLHWKFTKYGYMAAAEYGPIEFEIPVDNEKQGYIYIIDENESNPAMRFYHDDRFSGVQMPVEDPVRVHRVVSTTTTTYILYKEDEDPDEILRLYAVNLPSEFYTDNQYAPGRFPKVYGNQITISEPFKIREISSMDDCCVMYLYNATQTVGQTPKPPKIATYGPYGYGEICSLPGSVVDPEKYVSYRMIGNVDTASYTAPSNQTVTFLLISETVVIVDIETISIISTVDEYSLYRITNEFKVYRYAFSQGLFIPGDNDGFYPVLQMVCYDTNEVEEGDEESEDPGITHLVIRYLNKSYDYSDYNGTHNVPVSNLKQISIPHSSFERVW